MMVTFSSGQAAMVAAQYPTERMPFFMPAMSAMAASAMASATASIMFRETGVTTSVSLFVFVLLTVVFLLTLVVLISLLILSGLTGLRRLESLVGLLRERATSAVMGD